MFQSTIDTLYAFDNATDNVKYDLDRERRKSDRLEQDVAQLKRELKKKTTRCLDLEAQLNELTCCDNIDIKTKTINQQLQLTYNIYGKSYLIEDSNVEESSITNTNTNTRGITPTLHDDEPSEQIQTMHVPSDEVLRLKEYIQQLETTLKERNVYINNINRRMNDGIMKNHKSDTITINTLQEQIHVLNEALQSTRSRLAIREADVDRLNADIERLIRQSHHQQQHHHQQPPPISPLSMNSVTSLSALVVTDTEATSVKIPNTVHNVETTTGTVRSSNSTMKNNDMTNMLLSSSSSIVVDTSSTGQQQQQQRQQQQQQPTTTTIHVRSDQDRAMALEQLELDRMTQTEMVRQLRQSVLSKYTKKKQQQQQQQHRVSNVTK